MFFAGELLLVFKNRFNKLLRFFEPHGVNGKTNDI